jgi:hypothetical protein
VLFGAALLCKQSMVAGLVAACLALMAARRRRDLRLTLASFAIVVGGVFVWQHLATDGWFWWHTITCQAHDWRLEQFSDISGPVVTLHLLLVALTLADLVAHVAVARQGKQAPMPSPHSVKNPAHFYLAGAVVVGLLSGKVGSEVNYFLDLVAALCIVGVSSAARRGEFIERHRSRGAGLTLASALLCIQVWGSFTYPPVGDRPPREVILRGVTQVLAQARGPVIAEEPGLAPVSGKPLWIQPFEFTQLAEAGRWDQGPLVAALAQARFPVIVLRFDPWNQARRSPNGTWEAGRFTDYMVSAIRSTYRISKRLGDPELGVWVVLLPGSAAGPPLAVLEGRDER